MPFAVGLTLTHVVAAVRKKPDPVAPARPVSIGSLALTLEFALGLFLTPSDDPWELSTTFWSWKQSYI